MDRETIIIIIIGVLTIGAFIFVVKEQNKK